MITVCGEGVVDLVHQGGGTYLACPGGSPLNVAVGVARLGEPVGLLARIGTGPFGRLLRDHLRDAGVGEHHLVDAGEPATLAAVTVGPDGQADYAFYCQGTADWQWRTGELPDPLPPDTTALHTGSLACAIPPGADAVEALLGREHRRGQVTVSYDPNIRPDLMGERAAAVDRVERLVGLADLVKVSDQDLTWLYPDRDPLQVAADWAGRGPGLVVTTLGEHGAVAHTAAGLRVTRPAHAVEVADTVGAGDAFTAGLLTGLARLGALGAPGRAAWQALDGAALGDLLDRAGLAAALTCTRRGAVPPTRAELDRAAAPGDLSRRRPP